MKRFYLVMACALLIVQSICPMAGMNATSQGWFNSFKNSASGAFSKALSYCSLQKVKEASDFTIDTIKNNKKLSASIFAAAAGTGIGAAYAAHLYKWRERKNTGWPNEAPCIAWSGSLKYVTQKIDKPEEDDIKATFKEVEVPASRKNSHSVLREYTQEPRARYFEPLINNTRMTGAEDYTIINPYYTPTAVKHAGIKITRRSPVDEHTQRVLLRYAFTDAQEKRITINRIFINGMSSTVNEMIVHQKAKHLANPALYVTLKHANREDLQKQADKINFTVINDSLYVDMNESPFALGKNSCDIELHLPQGYKKPEIIYVVQQERPIKQITY